MHLCISKMNLDISQTALEKFTETQRRKKATARVRMLGILLRLCFNSYLCTHVPIISPHLALTCRANYNALAHSGFFCSSMVSLANVAKKIN